MQLSLSVDELTNYVTDQVNHFFPDRLTDHLSQYKPAVELALQRLEFCFQHISISHYFQNGNARFNHLFSDQYATFLWFLANSLWQEEIPDRLLNKLFCLNKALHAFECMYDTLLPDVFFLSHTVGTVLGKASYGNYLVISQGCTVGTHGGCYPTLGKGVALGAGASLIGCCKVGYNVSIGSSTPIFQRDIADNCVVYRDEKGELVIRSASKPYAQKFFNKDLQTIG